MEEDFSLSVNGADIQKKMPLVAPPTLGISELNLLKSEQMHSFQIGPFSMSLSENQLIKRSDIPRTLVNLSPREDLNSNTPKVSNQTSDQYSLDNELEIGNLASLENKGGSISDNPKAQYSVSDKQPSKHSRNTENPTVLMKYPSGSINVLQRYRLLSRAIEVMRKHTSFRRLQGISPTHFEILNDKTCFMKAKKYLSYDISNFLDSDLLPYKKTRKILQKFVITPLKCFLKSFELMLLPWIVEKIKKLTLDQFNPLRMALELARLAIVGYFFFEFSVEISLEIDTRSRHVFVEKIFILGVLVLEFMLGGDKESVFLESQKKQLSLPRLLCKSLGFLSVFLYFILNHCCYSQYINLLLLFYYQDCRNTLDFWKLAARKQQKLVDFLFILCKFVFLLHCLSFFAVCSGLFSTDATLNSLIMKDSSVSIYFYCMIAIFRLIFMIPSLNIDPNEGSYIRHFIFLVLWSLLVLNFLMEYAWRFFDVSHSKDLKALDSYLKMNPMGFSTELKLRHYFKGLEQAQNSNDLSASIQLVNSLEKSLKNKLLKNSRIMKISNYLPLFLRFSKQTNKKLMQRLKYRVVKPGEFAFKQGEISPGLILIVSGSFELSFGYRENEKNNMVFGKAQKEESLGEMELFTGNPWSFSAKSLDYSSILELPKEDFILILQENLPDYEIFCMIHDQITLYNDFSSIFSRCSVCRHATTHTLEQCPLIHYIPNSEFLIQRHIYNGISKRKDFKRVQKKRKNALSTAAQNRFFAMQVNYDQRERSQKSDEDIDLAMQEQSSILYPSDYSVESGEDDFSEEDFKKSTNTLPSIKRGDKIDSLEVIDEESKSKSGTVLVNNKSAIEIGSPDDKFTTKLLDTKAFDTKRNISATEIKIESKIMTEGGKLFEDYLKRNSLLSKQSSIGKGNTTSLSEFIPKSNPHYKNTNAVLSLTENKTSAVSTGIKGRRNSIMVGTSHTNTGTKSNKSSKASKNTVFDMFMEFDNLGRFEAYFPENNCENVVARIKSNSKTRYSKIGSKYKNNKTETGTKTQDDRSFKFVNTIDSGNPKKSHFVAFKKKGKKTSIEKKSKFKV